MPIKRIHDQKGAPPYLESYRYMLDRLKDREQPDPDLMKVRARTLLEEWFGASPVEINTAFAYGPIDLMSLHTHYFDGFAMFMVLPQGTAVALRQTDAATSQVIFDGAAEPWRFGLVEPNGAETPTWICVFEEVMRRMRPNKTCIEVAVVSTVQPACMDAYLVALAVASVQALPVQPGAAPADEEVRRSRLSEVLTGCSKRPFGRAPLIAAQDGTPESFMLVDTANGEHLPIQMPARDEVGWGMVEVYASAAREPSFYATRQAQADEALRLLQAGGFTFLRSFRSLEHQQLQRALELLPKKLRPVVRHLVTENRRVQRLVVAVRRQDWQLFGALLLMGHASLRDDWGGSAEEADFVVRMVEEMTIEGMHGARLTGRDRCVLMAGRPFMVPQCLDRTQTTFKERFGQSPVTMLL